MGKSYDGLDDKLTRFIEQQHMFFVATAPTSPEGHINLSPKGLDTFRILNPKSVAYLDLVGSGVETIAHLRENGRLVIMFCAFDGKPLIVRLYGTGHAIEPGESGWDELIGRFPSLPGIRSVVVLDVQRIATSCGFGVPEYEYRGERTELVDYADRTGPEGMEQYKAKNNRLSIDGLPGLHLEDQSSRK